MSNHRPTNTEITLFAYRSIRRNVRIYRRFKRSASRLMQDTNRDASTRQETTIEPDDCDE